jgi:putative two-component system response regulator
MRTVLVVDDVPENLDLMRGILSPHVKVKVAISGSAALKLATANPPDLVLLDVMMPGMDGFETCRRLKQEDRTCAVPVIFVTAMGDAAATAQGAAVGAVDCIAKPIDPTDLLTRIRAHLPAEGGRP